VQVQINTVALSLGPVEIERLITAPVEAVIGGIPRLVEMRSISKFGLSQITATFEDGTDIYFARQRINEQLGSAKLQPGLICRRWGRWPRDWGGLSLHRRRQGRIRQPDRADDDPDGRSGRNC
jgi:hypothetical protein